MPANVLLHMFRIGYYALWLIFWGGNAIAFFILAKKQKLPYAWLSFIPYISLLSLAMLADDSGRKIGRYSKFLRNMIFMLLVGAITNIISVLYKHIDPFLSNSLVTVPIGLLMLLILIAVGFLFHNCLYRIYRVYVYDKKAKYTLIGIIIPITVPFLLFRIRNNQPTEGISVQKDFGGKFSELSNKLHNIGLGANEMLQSEDETELLPDYDEDQENYCDVDSLEFDIISQTYISLTPVEMKLKEIYLNRRLLPSQLEIIQEETETLLAYDPNQMLEKLSIPLFIKADITIQQMIKDTYEEAIKELSYYEGDHRKATAANKITQLKNEFRVVITIQEKSYPLKNQMQLEFGINN